jgi:hypothetical protein
MKNNIYLKKTLSARTVKCCLSLTFLSCLLFCNAANSKFHFYYKVSQYIVNEWRDTTDVEKKVDYIEKIYFSGKNKDDLNTLILITTQELEGKPATTAVAKQYIFLTGIKDKANAAKHACEVEELLAAGIYGIDAKEAILQNIPKPDGAATDKAGDALSKVSALSNSTGNLANNAALSTWNLSGGSVTSYVAIGKVAGAASTAGSVIGTAGSAMKVADDINKIKDLFPDKKPCKSVPQKDIQIGAHVLPDTAKSARQAAATKITIKNITYNQLSSVASAIEKFPGISSVNSDNFNNNTATILIIHSIKMKDLINRIIQSNNDVNFNVDGISANEATLSIK